jgi:hypothetical protein
MHHDLASFRMALFQPSTLEAIYQAQFAQCDQCAIAQRTVAGHQIFTLWNQFFTLCLDFYEGR